MEKKKNGIRYLILIIAMIAVLGWIVGVGIGKEHKGSAKNIGLGLDLAGGVSITYETVKSNPTQQQMVDTISKLRMRAEAITSESDVFQEGSNRITVNIPGEKDAEKILQKLGKAGALYFKDESGKVLLDGSHITTVNAGTDNSNGANVSYYVSLKFNTKGTKLFADATKNNLKKRIAIEYDGKVISNPVVNNAITNGEAQISNQTSIDEAEELATTIRIGALPLELKEARSNVIGAKLGVEALNTSILAGIIGFGLICIFMIFFYRIPGLAADIALVIYVGLILVVINGFDVILTLPGIAGVVLSIGMAVDANVIIYSRIKEEIAAGVSIKEAINLGFGKATSAILDSNITTLIAAAVLWLKGSGTVKGFAQTLAIGIILSLFTSMIVSRILIHIFYALGVNKEKYYGVQKARKSFPFIKHKNKFFAITGVLIIACVVCLVINKNQIGTMFNYGLDFKGGTVTQIYLKEKVDENTTENVNKLVKDSIGLETTSAIIEKENAVVIKTQELSSEQRKDLNEAIMAKYELEDNITSESISGSVSDDMKSDALIAVAIATISMLIYIAIRFRDLTFGMSAVIALLYDIIVVILVYAAARISVGNTFIACVLTILGYSINATIVIFDRIRENRAVMEPSETLQMVVDKSITQTLSRSINTTLTTFIMVLMLVLLGVESVREFTLPLMLGIVAGAYSSIFVTGALWYTIKTRFGRKKEIV